MPSDLHVRDLYIYPLKSGAGLRVPAATLDALGLVGDRRWMVVDRNGRFVTQRELPEMALIRAELNGTGLSLAAPGVDPLHVATPSPTDHRMPVTVWDDLTEGVGAGDEAAAWLARVLDVDATLVYCPPDIPRKVDVRYASRDERVSFADGFPLLVIGQGSLDDLNARLEAGGADAVPMNRFRPNVVIGGSDAFAEDQWRRILIGEGPQAVEIEIVKPCARCSIIPVDQSTGIRGKEPLTTLTTYRRRDTKVYFGQNALHRSLGTICEGDPIRPIAD